MIGAKPYEFRDQRAWSGACGKRIVIHAGAPPVKGKDVETILKRLELGDETCGVKADIAVPVLNDWRMGRFEFPLKAALGTAYMGYSTQEPIMPGVGKLECDNWAYPMSQLKPWPVPVEIAGDRGFWPFPRDMMPPVSL